DAEFAIDRMRRRQQFPERLAAQHIGAGGRIEPVGRVRLPALELQHRQWPAIALDMIGEPRCELRLVKSVPLFDRLGAREDLVGRNCRRLAHSAARSRVVWRAYAMRAIERLCTSSGPSASRNVRMPA